MRPTFRIPAGFLFAGCALVLSFSSSGCSGTESLRQSVDIRAHPDPQAERVGYFYASENLDQVVAGGSGWIEARILEGSLGVPIWVESYGGGFLYARDAGAGVEIRLEYPETGLAVVPDEAAAVVWKLTPPQLRMYEATTDVWSFPALGLTLNAGALPGPALP